MNNMFFNLQKILSYNALLNIIIGERGVGKSYALKKYAAEHFIKTGKQFVYIRRYKTELKNAMMKNSEPAFWEQIKNDDKFKNTKFSNKKDIMYINDEIAGYGIPLSIANILKSATFDQVDTIIFDEFIIDKGNYHYLQNEVIQFLDVIETIARLRNIRIFLLGNAISITNPYFNFFNLSLPYNSEIKTFKEGLIALQYVKNPVYRETKKNTRFGKLISDTEYGKYAIDNQFLRDSKAFIKKKSQNAKFYFKLICSKQIYGVWHDIKSGELYISNQYDPYALITYAINPDDHDERTILLRGKINACMQNIITHYRLGSLFFENQTIKNNVMNQINKFLTY